MTYSKDDNGDLTLDDERIELAVKTTGAKLLVLDPIQAFIGTMLAESDMASVKIFEEMDRYGFSKRTVQEAKKEAGIQAYKKGNAWYWHMERSAADDGTGKTCCKPGRTEGENSGEV